MRIALVVLSFLVAAPAVAFEPRSGCFIASSACEATRSIRKQSNPGGVQLEPGHAYRLLGANKVAPTHFQILVPGAAPDARWVDLACGKEVATCDLPDTPGPDHQADEQYLLAVSWEPAFCETKRDKPECAGQTAQSPEATALALHGLWPQPRERAYCGVDATQKAIDRRGRWDLLRAPDLSPETQAALAAVMPGTQSHLERHEWIKHGTCSGLTADVYFRTAVDLLTQVNAGPVRALLDERIGRTVSLQEIRAAFDQDFGPGAGERVNMSCNRVGGRTLVGELQINLAGPLDGQTPIDPLLAAAPEAAETCREGEIDAVGFGGS